MRNIFEKILRHSWDVCTLIQNNSEFLVCLLVCLLASFLKLDKYRDISYAELDISLYLCHFRKEIQNYFELVYKYPRNVSIKSQKDISYRARDIPKLVRFHWGSMQTASLTDIQVIQKCLKLVYKHPRNVSKKCQNISHPELKISIYKPNFSKEVSKLMN